MITQNRIVRKRKKRIKFKSTDSDIEELHGLKGGEKNFWLNTHKAEVLAYLDEHGEAETCQHYGLKSPETLENLKHRWFVEYRNRPLLAAERYKLETAILQEDIEDLRKEIRELRELFWTFRESVSDQLTVKFFLPLMKAAVKLDPQLEKPENQVNPLSIDYILHHTNGMKE